MKDLKEISALREKAEFFINRNISGDEVTPNDEVLKLLHELEVYQIELEMQNEALLLAKENAEVMSRKYKALYDFAPMGYFALDRNGLILDVNKTGETMLGKEKAVLLGNYYQNVISRETQNYFQDFLNRIFDSNSHVNCELKLHSYQNKELYIYIEGVATSADSCLMATFDITERRLSEKALYENEARLQELNATKDKFFSIIGHDLRGPFTSILGFSELLLEQVQKENFSNIEKIVSIIHNSSLQAMDLLSNLLEWASLQTGKIKFNPDIININYVVDEVIGLLGGSIQQKSIVVSKNIYPDLEIFADYKMLSNVFRNIISNAIKFTPVGGSVTIEVKEQTEDFLILISDTGVGIAANDIKKLFKIDTVYSTKGTANEVGTGLGLLLCKEFIEIHGGRLWVESETDRGSNFVFTIPKNI